MWPALLVFSIYWIVLTRRRNPWPELIAALLMQLALLWVLAWLFPGWVWKAALLAYLSLSWWLTPWQLWRTNRNPLFSGAEPYDPERHPVAPALHHDVGRQVAAAEAAGLVHRGTFWHRNPAGVTVLQVLTQTPDGLESVAVTGQHSVLMEGTPEERVLQRVHAAYTVRFEDGLRLRIINADSDGQGSTRGVRLEWMPSAGDAGRVLAIGRAYRARFLADRRPVPVPGDLTLPDYMRAEERRNWDEELRAGRYRMLPDGQAGPTLWSAFLWVTASQTPFRQLLALRTRLREQRLMRTLGFAPAPAAERWWWRMPTDLAGAAVMATVLALLLPAPPLPAVALPIVPILTGVEAAPTAALRPARPYRLPDGFAVPADFAGAVRALEQLAGETAIPLRVVDDWPGEVRASDAMEVSVPGDLRDSLVAHAGPLFRARGFLLFRGDHTYAGMREYVALLPRNDHAEVIRLIGTSAPNYGIDTDSVVAWFAALHARHPFDVVGVGHDYVEGRFSRALTEDEAKTLAREFRAFCPDIVTQGTGTVGALAREMQRDRIAYCWWD